jgi:hypothetical protein
MDIETVNKSRRPETMSKVRKGMLAATQVTMKRQNCLSGHTPKEKHRSNLCPNNRLLTSSLYCFGTPASDSSGHF